ncbi:MAG: hypothetical protein WA990_05510 [Rubrobacteraceae bacterium]
MTSEYTYLKIPAMTGALPCVGLVLAGMVTRAKIGVGGLEEAIEVLESFHSETESTHYRFALGDDRVVAEVEGPGGEDDWFTVVELVS